MAVGSSERTRLSVTANSLLSQLEAERASSASLSDTPIDSKQAYLAQLKTNATVQHVKQLLAKLDQLPHNGPSTSSSGTASLYHRLSALESTQPSALPPPARPLKRAASNASLDSLRPKSPSSISSRPVSPLVPSEDGDALSPTPRATSPLAATDSPTIAPPPRATTPRGVLPVLPPPKVSVTAPPPSAKGKEPASSDSTRTGSPAPATGSVRIRSAAAREALLKSTRAASGEDSKDDKPTAITSATSGGAALLDHHHALQSELVSQLAGMSGQLKANAESFGGLLDKDKEVMEEAKKKLEDNHEGMVKQKVRLEGHKGKTRGTTCWTIGVVAAVAVAWVSVFLLIKVT